MNYRAMHRIMDRSLLTTADLKKAIRSHHGLKDEVYTIQCDSVRAIAYQDIFEAYMYFQGVRDWRWTDPSGSILPRQTRRKIFINLLKDIFLWPWVYVYLSQELNKMRSSAFLPDVGGEEGSILILRTDHWFNLRSGGSVGHQQGVINGMRQCGMKPYVISSDHLVGVSEDENFNVYKPEYSIGRNIPDMPEIFYSSQLLNYILRKYPDWKPACIYQRYSYGNYTGVVLKKMWNIPLVCEYNGSFTWMLENWNHRRSIHKSLIDAIELLNMNAADLIVVVSQALVDELVRRGVDKEKILLNPNGVDPDKYSPEVDSREIRKIYNLEDRVVIGFIGTFGPWHGAEILAQAFGELLLQHSKYQQEISLMLIGDGPTMPEVKLLLEKYGVINQCIFTGLVPQGEGAKYLAACDILVASHVRNPDGSPFFGSPTKLFEYMAMGKGIIASNLEQIGAILKHKNTAWLVEPGNVQELSDAMDFLIKNDNLRCSMGNAAREEVLKNYTWLKHTSKIISCLNDRGIL